jgi:SAM-dependent methyltransferase
MTMAALPWDRYAPFYDWENARTLGRRDVAFWRNVVRQEEAPALELGCGTGRLLVPLARGGLPVTGVDFSAGMLAYARVRARRLPRRLRPRLVRGDIRALPFPRRAFGAVLAPYGVLQSLLCDRDLDAALAEAARVLGRGGLFGLDLVPDLPRWSEHGARTQMRGRTRSGVRLELIESVRQDRRRGLTIFREQFVERRGRRVGRHRFTLTFRTLSMDDTIARVRRAGFRIDAVLGDYRGGAWNDGAETWIVIARKK